MIIKTSYVFEPVKKRMLEKKHISLIMGEHFNKPNATCVQNDADRNYQTMMLSLYKDNNGI